MADYKRRIVAEFSAQNKAKGTMAGFRRDMDSTGESMKNMATSALAVAGIGGGIYGLKRGFEYVTKAAMKQEDALFLLEAALKATGEYTEAGMERFEAFAASIQQATVYGDEEVLSLMQLMKSLGVTAGGLEQATRMAIGLAAATGRDVKSMSMYIALAQQGEFTMLRRYIPALRSTTDATEQLRIITEFAANGFKIAEAQAETTSGSFAQMTAAVGDLAEAVGEPFLDNMARDADDVKAAAEGATGAIEKMKKAAEEAYKSERRLKYMPIGQPFAVPIVPKDYFEEPEGLYISPYGLEQIDKMNEFLRLQKEAAEKQMFEEMPLVVAATKMQEILKARETQARVEKEMEAHRKKMLEEGGTLEAMQWRLSTERIRMQMEAETKAREKVEAAAVKIAERAAERRKRIAEDIAMAMASSWTNALDQMMFEGKKFWDAMEDMARSLIRTISQILIYKMVAEPIAYAAMGQPVPAQQGGVFTRPTLVRAGEVPEAFVPLSGGRSIPVEMRGGGEIVKSDVHIHNEGSEKLEISSAVEYFFSEQRVLDITTRAAKTNISFQNAIAQIKK